MPKRLLLVALIILPAIAFSATTIYVRRPPTVSEAIALIMISTAGWAGFLAAVAQFTGWNLKDLWHSSPTAVHMPVPTDLTRNQTASGENMRGRTAFMGYSSVDKDFATKLASDLSDAGVSVWLDTWEIKVGDSIIDKIAHGLDTNDYLLLVLSPDSVKSAWVRQELNTSLVRQLETKQVVVLPILHRDCHILAFLRDKRYVDFRNGNYDGGLRELLSILLSSKAP